MAIFDIPRFPEDEDMAPGDREGFEAFADGRLLVGMTTFEAQRGWWLAWARCYGMGVKASALAGDQPTENPWPQFSAPWEAWGEGFNHEHRL